MAVTDCFMFCVNTALLWTNPGTATAVDSISWEMRCVSFWASAAFNSAVGAAGACWPQAVKFGTRSAKLKSPARVRFITSPVSLIEA